MISAFFKTNCLTIFSLIYVILILILMIVKGKTKKISSKFFVLLLIFTVLSSVLYIGWGAYAVIESSMSVLFARISIFVFELWVYLFMLYLFAFVVGEEKIKEYLIKYKIGFCIISFIFVIINFLFCYFLNYGDINYGNGLFLMDGPLVVYCNILGFISILYGVLLFLFNLNKFDRIARILTIPSVLIISGSLLLTSFDILVLNDFTFRFTVLVVYLYLSLESRDKLLLDEFTMSTLSAEESDRLKSEFIMSMSHQLRTPMNTILGFSDLILMNDSDDLSSVKDDIDNIKYASRHLLNLISSILDISKLESNNEIINDENYKLENIIYDISSNINSKLKQNLVFTINADEICPNDLIGDPYKLSKILNIFIMTAVNHTEYGEVSLNISCVKVDNINYEFIFNIKNSGHLMKQDDFNRSFENLIKLSKDNNSDISSDVINLIVAKELVSLLGGSVEFINEKGMGTQYIIKLKQKLYGENKLGNIKDKIQSVHSISHQILNLVDKKVLIVDEDKVNVVILERLLSQYNINIETSLNPRDGVNLILNNKYDFIIVNHNMQDIGGDEFIKRLNSSGNKIPTTIGLLSKVNDNVNIYDYKLNCPVEFRELNKIINKIFNGGDL